MPIFGFTSGGRSDEDEMAKSAKLDQALIDRYVAELVAAEIDREAFDVVLAAIKADRRVKAGELAAIAMGYWGGGRKPATRDAAIASIGRRFADRLRTSARNETAAKVRPW